MRRLNYLTALTAALKDRPPTPGTVEIVQVLHDDWCRIFCGKGCNCSPAIVRGYALARLTAGPAFVSKGSANTRRRRTPIEPLTRTQRAQIGHTHNVCPYAATTYDAGITPDQNAQWFGGLTCRA